MRERRGRDCLRALQDKADQTVAEYQARTRAIAARLSIPDRTTPVADQDAELDNDVVESWLADPRDGAARTGAQDPASAAVDRIERGEMTWDEVLSGRATDRDSVALRTFLGDLVATIRAERQARR
ncbi:hypothetical protein [Actinophytocola sediminis]